MAETEPLFEELEDGSRIYDFRVQRYGEIEDSHQVYQRLRRKQQAWRRASVGMALAPIAAAGALLLTETAQKANNYQKFVVGFEFAIGAALSSAAVWWRSDGLKNKAIRLAEGVAPVEDQLGTGRSPWVVEALDEKYVQQEKERQLRERDYI